MNKAPRRTTPDYDTPINATEPMVVNHPEIDTPVKDFRLTCEAVAPAIVGTASEIGVEGRELVVQNIGGEVAVVAGNPGHCGVRRLS